MFSQSNSSQSTRPTGFVLGKNYASFLDYICNYERTSGIFSPRDADRFDGSICFITE